MKEIRDAFHEVLNKFNNTSIQAGTFVEALKLKHIDSLSPEETTKQLKKAIERLESITEDAIDGGKITLSLKREIYRVLNIEQPESEKVSSDGKKYPILVVDDEKKVTTSLESFFGTLGHKMYTAKDGEEANKIIDNAKPELVILDIRMPGIDGKEILKRTRNKYPHIKVIVITGYEEEAKEVEEIGSDGFFVKPVIIGDLIKRIKYVLETKEDTRVYPTKVVKEELAQTPKAKILFIEPDVNLYSYTCGLFSSTDKEINPGEFDVQVAYSLKDAMAMFGDNSIYGFHPDLVIIYDKIHREFEELDKIADYILTISFKPKEVIVHGIFPRKETEISRLERKGVKYCDQNVLTFDHYKEMNKKLIDFVSRECVRLRLVKK